MSIEIPLTPSAGNTSPAAKPRSITFASQDSLAEWVSGMMRAHTASVRPSGPADLRTSIEYIKRAIELHEYAHTARSYVPELTGEQRAYLRNEGYECGSSNECCWFQKASTFGISE